MSKMGLLIDYENCTGCYACVVACIQEHEYPQDKSGIVVNEIVTEGVDRVRIDNLVFPTELCDLCAKRVSGGEVPACVKHCQSSCIYFGPLDDLAKKMDGMERSALYAPMASARSTSD